MAMSTHHTSWQQEQKQVLRNRAQDAAWEFYVNASGNIRFEDATTKLGFEMVNDGTFTTDGTTAVVTALLDGVTLPFGTDSDWVIVERATILGANTALTGVIVGTPVTPAVAADSLIIGGITNDGDILVATATGGNSHAYWWIDSSAALSTFYAGAGVTNLVLNGSRALLPDSILLTLGTDGDIGMVNRATVLNANTTLTGVITGTPVTPAVAANSLIIGNITADGDIMLVTQTGGNSHAAMWVDASAAITRFYSGAGVEVLKLDSAAVTITGAVTNAGTWRRSGAGFFGLGTGEAVTIATGVATVTKPYVILDAEGAGTTDQLDSITYTGVADGDLLLLVSTATDTITVDDANINLGAATRALAPGGSLLLRYDGTETQWTEVAFLTAADNV